MPPRPDHNPARSPATYPGGEPLNRATHPDELSNHVAPSGGDLPGHATRSGGDLPGPATRPGGGELPSPGIRTSGGLADRIARAGVGVAARRWPEDLADEMRDAWLAELAAVDGPGRTRKRLTFAASLMVSPAVDEVGWRERGEALGRAAMVAGGVTLLAAASANAIRSGGAGLLLVGVVVFALIGLRCRAPIGLSGAALFGFLVAGNQVPVMPFMGVRDVAPVIVVWMAGMAVVVRLARRLAAAGRRRRAVWMAAGGGLITLDMAVAAGSLHAAATLGVSAWSAPLWFPLALLPGGTVSFGPHFADGAAAFGSLQAYGPAFHASDILLANAAVVAGPLVLISAFTAAAIRAALTRQNADRPGELARQSAAPPVDPSSQTGTRLSAGRRQFLVGAGAAVAAIVACPLLVTAGDDADGTLRRMLDNETGFGFGFAAHPVGQGVVALLAAVLVMGAVTRRDA
ncbi:hypothetical protein ACQPZJ_33935 [Actinoplanes sp. CA-054009]